MNGPQVEVVDELAAQLYLKKSIGDRKDCDCHDGRSCE